MSLSHAALRPLPGGTHGALVASAHGGTRRLLFSALEGEHLAVHMVEREDDAFLHAQVSRPSVVVVDAELVDGYGPRLCARLKADPITRHIAVVVISSAYERADYEAAVEAGADAFRNKPFSVVALRKLAAQLSVEAVTSALAASEAQAWMPPHGASVTATAIAPSAVAAMRRLKLALHPERFDIPPCAGMDTDTPATVKAV